jgi:hypothetical protein
MAVIYLPQNTQQYDISRALGSLSGGVFQGYQTQSKITAIKNAAQQGADPSSLLAIAGNDPQAQQAVKELVQIKQDQAKMALMQQQTQTSATEAETSKTQAQTAQGRFQLEQQEEPLKLKDLQARIGASNAAAAESGARVGFTRAETQKSLEETKRLQAQPSQQAALIQMLTGGSPGASTSADIQMPVGTNAGAPQQPVSYAQTLPPAKPLIPSPNPAVSAINSATSGAPGTVPPPNPVAAQFQQLDPLTRTAVLSDIASGKTSEGLALAGRSIAAKQKADAAEAKEKVLPQPAVQLAGNAAAVHSDIDTTLDQLPSVDTGSWQGKLAHLAVAYDLPGAAAVLGLTPGQKSSLALMDESVENAVANGAKAGGGFMSKVRIDLSSGILPSLTKSQATNLASAYVFESAQLGQLTATRDAYKAQGLNYNTKPLDQEIEHSKAILDRIQSYKYVNGGTDKATLIDTYTINKLVPEDGVKSLSGSRITRAMVEKGVALTQGQKSPVEVFKSLVSNLGGKDDSGN